LSDRRNSQVASTVMSVLLKRPCLRPALTGYRHTRCVHATMHSGHGLSTTWEQCLHAYSLGIYMAMCNGPETAAAFSSRAAPRPLSFKSIQEVPAYRFCCEQVYSRLMVVLSVYYLQLHRALFELRAGRGSEEMLLEVGPRLLCIYILLCMYMYSDAKSLWMVLIFMLCFTNSEAHFLLGVRSNCMRAARRACMLSMEMTWTCAMP
jgi:hypothetical protein